MDCKQVRQCLPAYVDRELGVRESIETERHLRECAGCRAEYDEQAALAGVVKEQATYYQARSGLRARILAALPRETAAVEERALVRRGWGRWDWSRLAGKGWTWANLGGALATGLAVVWSVGLFLALPSADDRLTEELVASHVRSLMADHIADVASSDQHTVKPWFNGKLDFSPSVGDFAAEGFPLIGGRLDYLSRRPVAALVYQHRKHLINLYVWPNPAHEESPVRAVSRQGYHMIHWADPAMNYWAVSDLDAHELEALVRILRNRAASAPG